MHRETIEQYVMGPDDRAKLTVDIDGQFKAEFANRDHHAHVKLTPQAARTLILDAIELAPLLNVDVTATAANLAEA